MVGSILPTIRRSGHSVGTSRLSSWNQLRTTRYSLTDGSGSPACTSRKYFLSGLISYILPVKPIGGPPETKRPSNSSLGLPKFLSSSYPCQRRKEG